jgi:hypothetical protein
MDNIRELAGQIFNAFGPWTGRPVAIQAGRNTSCPACCGLKPSACPGTSRRRRSRRSSASLSCAAAFGRIRGKQRMEGFLDLSSRVTVVDLPGNQLAMMG